MQFSKIARKVKNQAKINEELHSDRAFEQELILEKQRNRNMLAENAKLIQKPKEQKKKYEGIYEALYEEYKITLQKNKTQKGNNEMDICGSELEEHEEVRKDFDPKIVFSTIGSGNEPENANNNNNNIHAYCKITNSAAAALAASNYNNANLLNPKVKSRT